MQGAWSHDIVVDAKPTELQSQQGRCWVLTTKIICVLHEIMYNKIGWAVTYLAQTVQLDGRILMSCNLQALIILYSRRLHLAQVCPCEIMN